jgi:hypothetical protein
VPDPRIVGQTVQPVCRAGIALRPNPRVGRGENRAPFADGDKLSIGEDNIVESLRGAGRDVTPHDAVG